jgi:hypothetical protein
VSSFGTAADGWPAGPHYEQYENISDPVPGVISGAQLNYIPETYADSATPDQRHVFNQSFWNPIDAHSFDNVYVKELKEVHAPQCLCAGTKA